MGFAKTKKYILDGTTVSVTDMEGKVLDSPEQLELRKKLTTSGCRWRRKWTTTRPTNRVAERERVDGVREDRSYPATGEWI